MIQNFKTGKGFRGTVDYVEKKEESERLECGTLQGKNGREMSKEVSAFRAMRKNMKSAVVHVSLSISPDEKLNKKQWAEIANEYIEKMGFQNCAWTAFRHNDTKHDHIHIVCVRIDSNGKAVSDSHAFRRGAKVVQEIEKKYNLIQTAKTPDEARKMKTRAPKKGEIERFKKTGIPAEKEIIKASIEEILKNNSIKPDVFLERLEAAGIHARTVIKKNVITGISYEKNNIKVKGSQLGQKYTIKGLIKLGLDYNIKQDLNDKKRVQNEHKRRNTESNRKENDNYQGTNKRSQGLATSGTGDARKDRQQNRRDDSDNRTARASDGADQRRYTRNDTKINSNSTEKSEINNYKNEKDYRANTKRDRRLERSITRSTRSSATHEESIKNNQAKILSSVSSVRSAVRYGSRERILDLVQTHVHKSEDRNSMAGKSKNSKYSKRSVQMKPAHIIAKEKAWQAQAQALNATSYRLTFTHVNKKGFNLGKNKNNDAEKWYTADEVKNLIPFISAKNAQGYNIYITPKAEVNHYILLDDTNKEKLVELRKLGFTPSLVQESSPDNFQAVFIVPKKEISKFEQKVANNVMRRLNQKFGDPRISAVIHPFRMAGFANRKPKYNHKGKYPFVTIHAESGFKICKKMTSILDITRQQAQQDAEKQTQAVAQKQAQERKEYNTHAVKNWEPNSFNKFFSNATELEFLSERERQYKQAKKMVKIGKWKEIDESILDFRACKAVVTTKNQKELQDAIIKLSPAINTRHKDMSAYAERTVNAAYEQVQKEKTVMYQHRQKQELER